MDSLHAVACANRSHVDRKRRRALHFSDLRLAGLSPYRGSGAFLALHRRVWVHHHRPDLYSVAFCIRTMGSACARLWPVFSRQAWSTFVHYANFHFPPEPDGFYAYNALQQLAISLVVFVFAPISILAGASMSPGHGEPFSMVPARCLAEGRAPARSTSSDDALLGRRFFVVHVTLVVLTGFERNMNHIVLGTDNYHPLGMLLGFVGLAAVLGFVDRSPLHLLEGAAPAAAHTKGDLAAPASGHSQSAQPEQTDIRRIRSRHISGRTARCRYARTGNNWPRTTSATSS